MERGTQGQKGKSQQPLRHRAGRCGIPLRHLLASLPLNAQRAIPSPEISAHPFALHSRESPGHPEPPETEESSARALGQALITALSASPSQSFGAGPHCSGGSRPYLFYTVQTRSEDKILHLLLSLSPVPLMTVLNASQASAHSSSHPSLGFSIFPVLQPGAEPRDPGCSVSPSNLCQQEKKRGEETKKKKKNKPAPNPTEHPGG